jgi:lipopolysaccharide biosynthesis protein/glycosyltransferase involved in cell wall biosynthesis
MIENGSSRERPFIHMQDTATLKHSDTGVILHLFYPEMWGEIQSYLTNLGKDFDLFVTIPHEVNISEDVITAHFPQVQIYRCENRGRDIKPFLEVFSTIFELNYKYICKIHTKKSVHISTGQEWQRDMMDKLLGSPETVARIKQAFDEHADWGLIGPQGHVVPHFYYWTRNAEKVLTLAHSIGIPTDHVEFSYVAGSMFWFKPAALSLLLGDSILAQDFEPEQGQQDATLAHAFERMFGMISKFAGYKIAESDSHEIKLADSFSFHFNLLAEEFEKQVQAVGKLTQQTLHQEGMIRVLSNEISQKEAQVNQKEQVIQSLTRQLTEIRNSTAWSIALRITRIGAILFPLGTGRGRFARLSIQGIRTWRREGLTTALLKIKDHLFPAKAELMEIAPEEDTYVPLSEFDVNPANVLVKTIAFYLPQFHPIPENDAWWGEGFTEWTNVSKAQPNFEGHYQPHVPDELGYYDLRQPEIQKRQVELAKKYGIYGFCFYYYWFAGKRLLEVPLNQYLARPELDLPFCLCWANENWTRRWDGAEHEILIGQTHNEHEYLHFIQDISPHFLDSRYIRIDGKPILLVYRINLLPDPQTAARIWREECKRLGIGDIYLIAVQSFGITDPRPYGFDAAVEFPPSYLGAAKVNLKSLKITNPQYNGKAFDYHSAASIMMKKKADGYTLFKTVMLSWDNTARRQNEGHIFINATPSAYKNWLENLVSYTRKNLPEDKRFVFINAWNEWAEGTHLEPDQRNGYAYLQATAEAIQESSNKKFPFPPGWKILFVSHDAHKGGAQAVLLNAIAWFKEHTSLSIKVLCLEGGVLLPRFQALADTIVLSELQDFATRNSQELTESLLDFCSGKPDLIYGNSVAAGKAYAWLHKLNVPILTHVHELEESIHRYAADFIADVLSYSTHYIACSEAVSKNLIKNHAVDSKNITVVYASIERGPWGDEATFKDKQKQRRQLGLTAKNTLILGCGLGMPFRKGADLFIKLGEVLRQQGRSDFHLYWVGGFESKESDPRYGDWSDYQKMLVKTGLSNFVTFLGFKENVKEYYQAADIFVLPSREDPFPLVALEAAKARLPIVCFAEAGGAPDLVGDDAGFVVPFEGVKTMAEKVSLLIEDVDLRTKLGNRAREKFLSQFTVERTMPHILSTCRKVAGQKPSVSVIVPNYNHAKYLPKRLESIFNQTFQDIEVILLDDASMDNSMEIIEQYAHYGDVRVHKNDQNSGSPFKQWLLGLDMAQADIFWIAESDDMCEPVFLEKLLAAFRDPAVKLAYANSHIVNEHGEIVGNYPGTKYLASLSTEKWNQNYKVDSEQEINDGLGIKNTILNISAVLIRRFPIDLETCEALKSMHLAGDWYFIVQALKKGRVAYNSMKLNSHRRHSKSVIAQAVSDKKLQEFFHESFLVHKEIVKSYRLHAGFAQKWETYLRDQWSDFTGGESFDKISKYYPFEAMKNVILQSDGAQHVDD